MLAADRRRLLLLLPSLAEFGWTSANFRRRDFGSLAAHLAPFPQFWGNGGILLQRSQLPFLGPLGFDLLDAQGKEGKLRGVEVAAVNVEAEHEPERVAGADLGRRR